MKFKETTIKLNNIEYKSVIVQRELNKGWQGYIGVPKYHSLFGKNYTDTIDARFDSDMSLENAIEKKGIINLLVNADKVDDNRQSIDMVFNVHGGITYAGYEYWNLRDASIIETNEFKYYSKVQKLLRRCGNELFSHYHKLGVEIYNYKYLSDDEKITWRQNILNRNALRVNTIYNKLKTIKKPETIETRVGLKTKNWGLDKNSKVLIANDDYCFFGWDCEHYGDYPSEFDESRAKDENIDLVQQINNYEIQVK